MKRQSSKKKTELAPTADSVQLTTEGGEGDKKDGDAAGDDKDGDVAGDNKDGEEEEAEFDCVAEEEAMIRWETMTQEGMLSETFPEGKHATQPAYTSIKTQKKDGSGYLTWEVLLLRRLLILSPALILNLFTQHSLIIFVPTPSIIFFCAQNQNQTLKPNPLPHSAADGNYRAYERRPAPNGYHRRGGEQLGNVDGCESALRNVRERKPNKSPVGLPSSPPSRRGCCCCCCEAGSKGEGEGGSSKGQSESEIPGEVRGTG